MGGDDLLEVSTGDPVDLCGDCSVAGRVDRCWQSLRDGSSGHVLHCSSFDRQCRRQGKEEKEKREDKSVGLDRHVVGRNEIEFVWLKERMLIVGNS